ncbi:hypothetical protein ANCCAN_18716 [Ancylostoma caninum]|uniref:Uncharacterized protein n=1 Tax=Ancylostoma caninum TaxID=29170 RepID=A0A368FT68_ANCCA|nr:hypothetical protein ANCCAN_18716 [Ancylostoma caninum]
MQTADSPDSGRPSSNESSDNATTAVEKPTLNGLARSENPSSEKQIYKSYNMHIISVSNH